MHSYRLTLFARNDLINIREFGEDRFGISTVNEYERLINQAIKDIRVDPYRVGNKERLEFGESFRSYHISFSRRNAASKIKKPRHFIIYYKDTENVIVISRILRDSMDLKRHVPEEEL